MIRNFQAVQSPVFDRLVRDNTPPVIMQLLPALGPGGGVEEGVVDISRAVVEAGGISLVVSSGGARAYDITRHGGVHIDLPVHRKSPLAIWRNARALRKIIRDRNVDIVHACSRAPAWAALYAVRGTRAHFMTSCHAAHGITGAFKRRYNSVMGRGERVIAVSHYIADVLEREYRVAPERLRVVHRGLSLARFHPNSVSAERLIAVAKNWRLPDSASVVMLPGRLTRAKGHKLLIDALSRIARDDVFCVFVGSDQGRTAYRRELEAHISEKGMTGKVRMVDHCDDMPAAYMMASVVVVPSLEPEGFGRVAVEAQAMGRPVIAADHGGTAETILRDETGWLVRPDQAQELAQALREALALDLRQRAVLATRSMAHVARHFTLEKMCAETLGVYAEILDAGMAGQADGKGRQDQKRAAGLSGMLRRAASL